MIIKEAMIFYEGSFRNLELEFHGDRIIRIGDHLYGKSNPYRAFSGIRFQ